MPSIQSNLKRRKPTNDFFLQEMQVLHRQNQDKPDHPHRHDYFTVILVGKAMGKHVIDYQTYPFGCNEVHFVSPGQIHQVVTTSVPLGWVITFSRDFLMENNIPESFISNINLFRQFGETPPLPVDGEIFDQLRQITREMQEAIAAGARYRNRVLGALLQLFLIHCSNSCSLDAKQLNEEDSGVCMLRAFKQLVEEKFNQWHQVSQYADKIHISSKHLSQTVKKMSGKSAKEFIQDRITLEAKRLLLHTPLSIKEISYQLGFADPLHFSSYIRKQTGLSPSHLRATG
ncbi:MAG: helix-turn-helix domain-containing protein [Saprospiraceae bacterium]|nr:helix-turn-helix domain-containing protein [Saprospiraceae bacterium]